MSPKKPTQVLNSLRTQVLEVKKMYESGVFEEDMIDSQLEEISLFLKTYLDESVNYWYLSYSKAYHFFYKGKMSRFIKGFSKLTRNTRDFDRLIKGLDQMIIMSKDKSLKADERIPLIIVKHRGFRVLCYGISRNSKDKLLLAFDFVYLSFLKRGFIPLDRIIDFTVVMRKWNSRDIISKKWGKQFGYFDPRRKQLGITDAILDPTVKGNLNLKVEAFHEMLVHELGHAVHLSYLTSEAKAFWDFPWKKILKGEETLSEKEVYEKVEVFQELGTVSAYGSRNEKEDFAETFTLFVLDPKNLNPRALERMEKTLEISAEGGKSLLK